MAASKDRSLGEMEALYKQKIQALTNQRVGLVKQLDDVDQKLKAYGEKLHWVRNLIVAPEDTAPPPPPAGKKKRKPRYSPVKEATLIVLRNRRGQWLTARKIRTLIRTDTSRRVSRQSVNVNLNLLEREGHVKRRPAPKGSGGAQFVFSAA